MLRGLHMDLLATLNGKHILRFLIGPCVFKSCKTNGV